MFFGLEGRSLSLQIGGKGTLKSTISFSTSTTTSITAMATLASHLLPSPADVVLVLLLAVPVVLLFRRWRVRSGRGHPMEWPVLGILPPALANLHRIHDFIADLLRPAGATTYLNGPWFVSPDILLTADPANIHHIFTSNFHNYPKGNSFAEIFDVLGNGIFNSDHDSWKLQRKLAHSFMAQQSFRSFLLETSKMKVEHGILPLLSAAAADGAEVDLQELFLRFTFDTTCLLVMGVDPGCLSPDLPTVPFAKAMDTAEEALLFRHMIPMISWKLLRWLDIGEERRMKAAQATIDAFIEAEISRRKKEVAKLPSGDLLSSYLTSETTSTAFLRDTAVNLLLAGRDTTGSGLSWFFYLVAVHPRVRRKLLEELESCRKSSPDGAPEMEAVVPLVYLHAALLETLRLYPPVPFEHKVALEEDELPSGHRVTKETRIMVSLYAMGRAEGVWGEDCREFRPERWVNGRGRLRYEPSYKFMAFNSGPRTCLGKDMAMTQMKAVAAAVLWNFDVEVVEAAAVLPKVSIILHMKDGLRVRLRRRTTTAPGGVEADVEVGSSPSHPP